MKTKIAETLSGSQETDLAEVVLARLLAVDALTTCKIEKSKESQNDRVSRTQDSNKQKSHEKDVSFILRRNQSKLKRKLASRIRNKKLIV